MPSRPWNVVDALHGRAAGLAEYPPTHMAQPIDYRGYPRTSEEWAALAKIAGGHSKLTKDELRRLFMLGLVERQLDRVCLSHHGRATLGLQQ